MLFRLAKSHCRMYFFFLIIIWPALSFGLHASLTFMTFRVLKKRAENVSNARKRIINQPLKSEIEI